MTVPDLTFGSTVIIGCNAMGRSLDIHGVGGEYGGLSVQPADSDSDHGGCMFVISPPLPKPAGLSCWLV